jgi:hypothetical protein
MGGHVSAMINGHRCFLVERPRPGEASVVSRERIMKARRQDHDADDV